MVKKKILLLLSMVFIIASTCYFGSSGVNTAEASTSTYQGTYYDIFFIPDTGNGYSVDYAQGNYYDLADYNNYFYSKGWFFIRFYDADSYSTTGYSLTTLGNYSNYIDRIYATEISATTSTMSLSINGYSDSFKLTYYAASAPTCTLNGSSIYGSVGYITSTSSSVYLTASRFYKAKINGYSVDGDPSGSTAQVLMETSFQLSTAVLKSSYGLAINTSADVVLYGLDGSISTSTIYFDASAPYILYTITDGEIYTQSQWFVYYDALSGLHDLTIDGTLVATYYGDGVHSYKINTEGEHTIVMDDMAGNSRSYTITLDMSAPTISGITDGGYYKANASFTCADAITSVASVTDNGTALTASSGTYTISANGTHEIIVTDEAGWTTTYTIVVDKTGPTVSGITNGSIYNEAKTLTCTTVSGIKSIALTYTDTDGISNSNTVNDGYTCYSNGTYTATITDNAGNSKTYSFTVDRTAPVVRGVVNKGSYEGSATVTVEDFTDTEVTLNGDGVENTFTVSEAGNYTIVATDAAGNSTTVYFTVTEATSTGSSTDGSSTDGSSTDSSDGSDGSTDESTDSSTDGTTTDGSTTGTTDGTSNNGADSTSGTNTTTNTTTNNTTEGSNTTTNTTTIINNTSSTDTEGNDVTEVVVSEDKIKVGTVVTIGNYTYKITKVATTKAGTVTILGATKSTLKTIKVANTVTINGMSYKVTAIANKAFAGSKKATKVVIGNNVKTIGNSAFAKCTKLKKVTIGKKVTKIGKKAFSGDKKAKITIKSTKVKSVGKKAFSKVKSVTVKSTKVKKLVKKAGAKSITVK